VHVRKS